MVSTDEKFDPSIPLYNQINTGYIDKMYSKYNIFCPSLIKEMNFGPGSHKCEPVGFDNKIVIGPKTFLLHFKFIGGYKRLVERQKDYSKRLSRVNISNNQGLHYLEKNSIENQYKTAINRSIKII